MRRLDIATRELMQRSLGGQPTVCVSANCPNIGECWSRGTATFMIMGDRCTRGCPFCDVPHGRPEALDPSEPRRLAESVRRLGLAYVVITCVDRDDLPDSGAAHWVRCVEAIRSEFASTGNGEPLPVELLTGDFRGVVEHIAAVARTRPAVFGHNVETVPRLQHTVRCGASWERSLDVLRITRQTAAQEEFPLLTKSGLMVGLGEERAEVREALRLLRADGVDLVTVGQYLKPRGLPGKLEVQRFIPPEEFAEIARFAHELGFLGVAAGPLTRSSHQAETLYAEAWK